jgi:S1-C subfamily serine protease
MKTLKWLGIPMALLASGAYAQQNAPVVIEEHVVIDRQAVAPDQRDRLQEAQRALEAAAREVARLSMGAAGLASHEVMEQFQKTGRRAMLGITIEDTEGGSVVTGVSPGGPAAESGVKSGVIIIGVNGEDLAAAASPTRVLIQQMATVDPGDTVRLKIRGAAGDKLIPVATRAFEPAAFGFASGPGGDFSMAFEDTGQRFPGLAHFSRPHLQPWADMELVELTPALGAYFGTEQGLLVVRAPQEDSVDLTDGDVILEIGGREPQNTAHAIRILRSFEPGEEMSLAIMRKQRQRKVSFKIPDNHKVSKR